MFLILCDLNFCICLQFMRDELQYKDGSNERLSIFHGNDKLISVEDLWRAWKKSQGKMEGQCTQPTPPPTPHTHSVTKCWRTTYYLNTYTIFIIFLTAKKESKFCNVAKLPQIQYMHLHNI